MVPTQAPKTASLDSKVLGSSWPERLVPPSAWRVKGFSIWTLTLCALLFSSSLTTTSKAQNNRVSDSTTQSISTDDLSQSPSQLSSQPTSSDSSDQSPDVRPEISSGVATTPAAPKRETLRFTVKVSGKERKGEVAVTPKMTVGQALAAIGISLAVLDRVTPDASALARDGMSVRVNRVSSSVSKRRTAIPAEVRYQPTTKLKAGTKQVVQYPKAGYYEVSERVWKLDGKVTNRQFVSKKVGAAPQHKIIALGTSSHLMPSSIRYHRRYASALSARGGSPRNRGPVQLQAPSGTFRVAKTLTIKSSAYSAGPAGGAISNWTATGVRCTYGAVAVDPRIIPLGSKLYIEGYGYGFACDTGGAIKGRRVDLAFNSPRAAFAWGRKTVKVHILAP